MMRSCCVILCIVAACGGDQNATPASEADVGDGETSALDVSLDVATPAEDADSVGDGDGPHHDAVADGEPSEAVGGDVPVVDTSPGDIAQETLDAKDSVEVPAEPADPPTSLGGGFVDISPQASSLVIDSVGVDGYADLTAAFFGDLDQDGVVEVFFTRDAHWDADPDTVVYAYVNGSLEPDSGWSLPPGRVLGVEDMDGDGHLDLILPGDPEQGQILWSDGEGGLLPQAPLAPAWSNSLGYADHSPVAFADVDQDGWLDILTSTSGTCTGDTPELMPLLRVTPRTFEARPDLHDTLHFGIGYAVLAAPLDTGEMVYGVFGQFTACGGLNEVFYREIGLTPQGYPLLDAFDPVNYEMGVHSPMGGSVADFDRDGALDLMVNTDPRHAFFRGVGSWPMEEVTEATGIEHVLATSGEPMLAWGGAALDVDQDGWTDILNAHGDDNKTFKSGSIGPQRATFHWNDHAGGFVDLSELAGLGEEGNWHALVVGDLDGDGDGDLTIGGLGHQPRVLRNEVDTGHQGLTVRLRGRLSNHLGVGAIVELLGEGGEVKQTHAMGHNATPVGVCRAELTIGLGVQTSATLRVRWPSGYQQKVGPLASGEVHVVEEPALVTIVPASRRVSAGANGKVLVTVAPVDADGAPLDPSTVTLELAYGEGIVGAPEISQGAAVFEVLAPASSGSAVLEVSVDGEPYNVRPRLWWD